jgi:hypothetical protein
MSNFLPPFLLIIGDKQEARKISLEMEPSTQVAGRELSRRRCFSQASRLTAHGDDVDVAVTQVASHHRLNLRRGYGAAL